MEITYGGIHAWLVYSTWTDSRYVVVWEHFHLAIILWYTVALVDERWEIFFNIRALKETFYRCLLGYVIVKLKLESNTPMITLYIKAYWFIMRISTSDILRLKQPCTTIIEHVGKKKVTFVLFDLTGRITDACFEIPIMQLNHFNVYRMSLNHFATRKVLKSFWVSQPWHFGTLWLW